MKRFRQLLRDAYKRGYRKALNENLRPDKIRDSKDIEDWVELRNFQSKVSEIINNAIESTMEELGMKTPRALKRDEEEYFNYFLLEVGLRGKQLILRWELRNDLHYLLRGAFYEVANNFICGKYYKWSDAVTGVISENPQPFKEVIQKITQSINGHITKEDIEQDGNLELLLGTLIYYVNSTVERLFDEYSRLGILCDDTGGGTKITRKDQICYSFIYNMWHEIIKGDE